MNSQHHSTTSEQIFVNSGIREF